MCSGVCIQTLPTELVRDVASFGKGRASSVCRFGLAPCCRSSAVRLARPCRQAVCNGVSPWTERNGPNQSTFRLGDNDSLSAETQFRSPVPVTVLGSSYYQLTAMTFDPFLLLSSPFPCAIILSFFSLLKHPPNSLAPHFLHFQWPF